MANPISAASSRRGQWLRALLMVMLVAATSLLFVRAKRAGALADWRQVLSLAIFGGMIWGILLYEKHRLIVGLSAVAAVVGMGIFASAREFVAAAGLDVILFLLGTFLVAGYLEESLFFEHLGSRIVRHAGRGPTTLLGALMLSAMAASAIVGEVAAILFVGGAMLHIAQRYRLQPIAFLIMLVFATNIGSAASAFGPVGVTIAIKAHLTVLDFFRWATPIAVAVLVLVMAICRWWFARDWRRLAKAMSEASAAGSIPDPLRRSVWPAWTLAVVMTALFVFHVQIERISGLGPQIVLPAAALLAGGAALLMAGKSAGRIVRTRVDWGTLVFFLTLFLAVGAMEVTGVTGAIAQLLMRGVGRNPARLVLVVGWATGFLSALLANLLAVAAFLPIVAQLKNQGAACPDAVYWLMLFGATFMGNMTSIGSTCNIIACGMADKRGHGTIYFRSWLRIGLIVSLLSMVLATLLLAAQTRGFTKP